MDEQQSLVDSASQLERKRIRFPYRALATQLTARGRLVVRDRRWVARRSSWSVDSRCASFPGFAVDRGRPAV